MLHMAGADYLRTLGIPLQRGRMFTEEEVDSARPVAVINEAAARLWPAGEDPVGRLLELDELKTPRGLTLSSTNASADVTLIGVMGNARNDDVRSDPQPAVLVPYTMLALRSAFWPSARWVTRTRSATRYACRCERWIGNSPSTVR